MVALVGKHFISREGLGVVNSLRTKQLDLESSDKPPIQMLAQLPSEECGCPEEVWRVDGMILLFHFEDDGPCHAFIDAGDWEMETQISARSLDHLRALSFGWMADIINQPDEDCRHRGGFTGGV